MTHVELLDTPGRVARPQGAARAIGPDVVEGAVDAPTAVATAVIPARGGSQGLPGKNLARVGGIPLVARAVMAALAAERIGRVVVTTDDDEIAGAARAAGAEVVVRPASLAGPTASSESAVLHALERLVAEAPAAAASSRQRKTCVGEAENTASRWPRSTWSMAASTSAGSMNGDVAWMRTVTSPP